MSDALTPQLALAYLAELEPALEPVAILDSDGRLLAGALAPEASSAFTQSDDRHTIRAPRAEVLPGLAALDVENVLADLGARAPKAEGS